LAKDRIQLFLSFLTEQIYKIYNNEICGNIAIGLVFSGGGRSASVVQIPGGSKG
jgi:hypothetical protein